VVSPLFAFALPEMQTALIIPADGRVARDLGCGSGGRRPMESRPLQS
jgi:hypothetical protein